MIGNDFDLALGLNTTYQDFMMLYINAKIMPELIHVGRFQDQILTVELIKDSSVRIPRECTIHYVQDFYSQIISANKITPGSGNLRF